MRGPNAHNGRRSVAALAMCVAALGTARRAEAKVYAEWQPRVSVGAGYDDNILLNGTGGDPFGQLLPGLKLYLFGDHGMKSVFDCQAGVSRLARPDQFPGAGGDLVLNQRCGADFKSRLGARTGLKFSFIEQYAQDPFSIANLGLLLRPGQRNIFQSRLRSELSVRSDLHDTWLIGIDQDALYFSSGDPGNGMVVTPHVAFERQTSARDTFSLAAREQMFFALGSATVAAQQTWAANSTGSGSALLGGYRRRLNHVTTVEVVAGPSVVAQPSGTHFLPVGRVDLDWATPTAGLHATVLHDLVLGPNRGGPLIGDIGEVGVTANIFESLRGHLRAGVYRNQAVGAASSGVIGYGTGAGLDWLLGRAWTLGATYGRDSRLGGDDVDHLVDRNVVQLRLVWEQPKDW